MSDHAENPGPGEGHGERAPHPIFVALARFLVSRRKPLFAGLVGLILLGCLFIPRVAVDNSIELWFLDDDPALVSYNEFKAVYGNDEVVVAMIDAGEGGVFQPEFLNRLSAASRALEGNEYVRRVLSIGKSPWIGLTGATDEATLVVEDLVEGTVETQADADRIRARFFETRLWPKLLADKDLRRAIVIVEPVASHEMDARRPLILAHVRDCLKGFPDVKLAGMGVMYNELNELSFRDGGIFTTLSYAALVLAVLLLYRSRPMTGIILVVMVLSALAFLGLFGLFGQKINMVTMVLPTLVMILSIADAIHVYNGYLVHRDRIAADREGGIAAVLAEAMVPCFFTSLTTALGFASLYTSSIVVLRAFGLFAAAAAMIEYVIAIAACAFFLPMLDPLRTGDLHRPFVAFGDGLLALASGRAGLVTAAFLLLLAFCGAGIARLDVDTYSMGFLMEKNPVRRASDAVEAAYGNYLPLEIRLKTGIPDGVRRVDFLRRVRSAEVELERRPEFQKVASMTDVVMRLHQLWTDGRPESYRLPDTDLQVVQLLDFYAADPDNDLKYMTDPDRRELRLTARIPMVPASEMRRIEDLARSILEPRFAGTGVAVEFSGYVPLYVRLLDYITKSQISSFATAFCLIFLSIGLLFRRASVVVLGVVPNVVPIVMILGFMGFTGIRLDIATVTIAAITLGIAVDDTIHILFHHYRFLDAGHTPGEAIRRCLAMEGSAVITTSLILVVGFSVLCLADIKSVVYFGLLTSLTMIFALAGDTLMLPAMITWYSRSGRDKAA